MRLKSVITLASLLPTLLVAGCGASPNSAGSAPPPKEAHAKSYSWIGRDKVGKAIALLQNGDASSARKILTGVLDRQPNDGVAQSLLKQIDEDPKTLLGTESFAYTSRAGDSFSSLAQQFLGNPTLFYALARYNGVTPPVALAKGTELRIPGSPKREAPRAELRPEPVARPVPVKPAPPTPPAPATDPRRAAQLRAQGLEAMNRGAIDRAVALLTEASHRDPANALIKKDLDRAIRIRRTVAGKKD